VNLVADDPTLNDTTGVAFPFRIDPVTGGVQRQSGDDKLRSNVIHIIMTNIGERLMRRGYGAGCASWCRTPMIRCCGR
jgi:phage baseplate assembly protein W